MAAHQLSCFALLCAHESLGISRCSTYSSRRTQGACCSYRGLYSTVTGNQWSYHEWQSELQKDFEIFGDSIRQDHPQTVEEEESEVHCASRKGPEEQNARKDLEYR